MSRGTLVSIVVPGAPIDGLGAIAPPEVLGAIVPPEVVPAAGAAVVPAGVFRGVSFCCGAEVCAEAVAATAPNEAISKALRIFRCIMICSFPQRVGRQPQWIGPYKWTRGGLSTVRAASLTAVDGAIRHCL